MVRQRRHLFPRALAGNTDGWMRPVGLEVELLVRMRKTVKVMRGPEIRLNIAPQVGLQRCDIAMAALLQRGVDQFARRHLEGGVHRVEAPAKSLQYFMVGAAFAWRIDQFGADRDMLLATAVIEIVVLHEHGRRQHDVGHLGRLGHELLVHRDEQILPRETLPHQCLLRRHRHRIGVLDQHRLDRPAALQRFRITRKNASDPGLIERTR